MTLHPFVEPFVVVATLDVLMVICAAAVRVGVCRDKPLAFHMLAVWSVVVLFANVGNELGARPSVVLMFVAAGVGGLIALSRVSKPATAGTIGIRDQWKDIGTVLAALGLQIALFLPPLFVLPTHTFIAGYIVCNDSVTHSIMMRGLETVSGEFAPWIWLGYYPAGFHAVVFALGPLFRSADVPTLLLPVSMWAASFLALAVLMLLHEERERGRWTTVLIAASPAAAFLVATSVYLNFIGHIGVMSFLVGCVVIAASWRAADLRGRGLVLVLLPIAAAAATYGLLALTAIGFAVSLRLAWAFRKWARMPAIVRETLRSWLAPAVVMGVLAVLIVSVPVARRIVTGYAFFVDQSTTVGNLPGGFLSPFHVTGFWKGGIEYRSQLPGKESPLTMILAAILIGEVLLVARAGLTRAAIIPLLTLGVPVVMSAIVVRSPYVNFKYLCLFTAVWVPVAMLGLSRWMRRLADGHPAPSVVALAGVLVMLVGSPLRSFQLLPALPDHWFREMALMRAQHFSRGPVLVLSKEDWFHYYRDSDDIVPLTYMFPQTYDGQPMREVLVDSAFQKDAVAFLAAHLPGAETRLDVCGSDFIGARYHIYQFSCLTGARP